MNFEYRENADGSFELFNNEYNDIYFSNVGAYKEALEKFVLPANPKLYKNTNINILDVCYGMGFNSKTFVDYSIKNNLNINFKIDCIELDENILALGLFLFDKNISFDTHIMFGNFLLQQVNLKNNVNYISGKEWINDIIAQNPDLRKKFFDPNSMFLPKPDEILAYLHNIYYQNHGVLEKYTHFFEINFKLGKLESILPKIKGKYDLIFHDAFSILKQPQLWSEDIMQGYYSILKPNGKLLTYSNSRVLRRTLEKVGFDVVINTVGDRPQNGTIAIKPLK